MLRKKALEEIKEALLTPQKSDSDLNVTPTQKLKGIFKENEFLKLIPSNQRSEVTPSQFCRHMTLIELNPLDTLLHETDRTPPFYLLLHGRLQIKTRNSDDQTLETYDIFGYTKPLTDQKWVPGKVQARESSSVIALPRQKLKFLVEKLKKLEEDAALIAFLVKTVPGVRQLGQANKERVLRAFERAVIKPGEVLLRERQRSSYACIIQKGECKLICSEDPLQRPGSAPARGLMSLTTSCFNFGLITEGEWVGEDSLLYDRPMEYTVQATTTVKVLRISKENFFEQLAKDTQNTLKANLEHKVQWIRERKSNISSTMQLTVYNQEASNTQATYEHTEKMYPRASRAALLNIRRNELIKSDYNSKLLLASPNARQSPVRLPSPEYEEPTFKEELQSYYVSRPISNSSNTRLINAKRPFSSYSAFNSRDKRLGGLLKHSTAALQPGKVKLHSACTLGYSLVPTMPHPRVKDPPALFHRVVKLPPKPKAEPENKSLSYAEKVRRGRPPSPNPVEVWARQQNIEIRSLYGLKPKLY